MCRLGFVNHATLAGSIPVPLLEQVSDGKLEAGQKVFPFEQAAGANELAAGGDVKIVACYPRAVKWLFNAAGVKLPETVEVLNMRTEPAEKITNVILGPGFGGNGK